MLQLNLVAGSPLPDYLIRMRHAKLMPHQIQMLLHSQPNLILQEYGELADTLMEAQFEQTTAWPTPASSIYHTTNTPPHLSSPVPAAAQPEPLSTPAATSAGMLHILQQLQEQVAQVGQLKQQQQHWQPRSRQQQQQHWQPPQQWQQIQWQPPQQQRQKQMQHYHQETCYYP